MAIIKIEIIRIETTKIEIMQKSCASNANSQDILPLTVPMEAITTTIKAIQQVDPITIPKSTTQIVIKIQHLLGKIKIIANLWQVCF